MGLEERKQAAAAVAMARRPGREAAVATSSKINGIYGESSEDEGSDVERRPGRVVAATTASKIAGMAPPKAVIREVTNKPLPRKRRKQTDDIRDLFAPRTKTAVTKAMGTTSATKV